jgi:hypothetical protein
MTAAVSVMPDDSPECEIVASVRRRDGVGGANRTD